VKIKHLRQIGLILMIFFLTTGCGNHNGGGGGGAATGTVSGKIVSATTGEAIPNASLRTGPVTVISDADGVFTLTTEVGERVVIQIEAAGFVQTVQIARVIAEARVSLDVELLPIGVIESVDVASGGTVTVPDSSAQVDIPAGGLVPIGGGTASASVNVALTAINPAVNSNIMPGDYTAIFSGESAAVEIESFGALRVDVRDDNGERYTLRAGESASIRIPLGSLSETPPATIPLLIFNETTGRWVEEGEATLQGTAPDQFYVGTVQRFGAWNADKPMVTVFVSGCVRDTANQPVANVRVTTDGINYSGSASAFTNADGNFRVAMRRDALATLSVSFFDQDGKPVVTTINVGPFAEADVTLEDCIVTEPVPLQIIERRLPGGRVGTAYNARLTASNGTKPYNWRISSGNLPAGLTLDGASGRISGIPTEAGNFPITLEVQDSSTPAQSDTASFFISVSAPPPFAIVTSSLPAGVVGTAYTANLLATNGTQPYAWSVISGDLPAGLTLEGASGQISGTPTTEGTFNFTIEVQDSATPPRSDNRGFAISISAPGAPEAPAGVAAFSMDTQIRVSWNEVPDADSYNLYMASVPGVSKDNYSTLADGIQRTGVTPNYIETGLSNGTTYYFVVTAVNVNGESADSLEVSATPTPDIGGEPTRSTLSSGLYHNCAVLANGTLQCWGNNTWGQLGNGTNTASNTPVEVSGITTATAVSAKYLQGCALLANGTIQCWGFNLWGQLGNGTNVSSNTPVEVSGITTATAVSSGVSTTCALLANGTIQCWGNNGWGQLGNGTNVSSLTPVEVSGITTATAVSSGGSSACAVLANGTVRCWGRNHRGQLGNGTNVSSNTPVEVSGISTATAVSVGTDYSCALLANGTIRCWGFNSTGQLGNGTTTASNTPVEVSGITTASAVSTSGSGGHSCAVLANGTIRCWGANLLGQLGNGTATVASLTPVEVSGITTATRASSGWLHSCAELSNGTVQCWGYGGAGQLGNGSNASSLTPVQVSGLP